MHFLAKVRQIVNHKTHWVYSSCQCAKAAVFNVAYLRAFISSFIAFQKKRKAHLFSNLPLYPNGVSAFLQTPLCFFIFYLFTLLRNFFTFCLAATSVKQAARQTTFRRLV